MKQQVVDLASAAIGRRGDWIQRPRTPRLPRPASTWIGPALVALTTAIAWIPMQGATGEDGSVAFGLFIGAVSIILMAWSFVLALRVRVLERLFGGLDSMYKVHRWCGVGAVIAMFLHTSVEPEIEGGIRGASKSLADSAEGLAGFGEIMLYVLVAISLLRWFPYRWWRWTHKLLGVPFAFACFHFFTAEKPYANGSSWGIYFGSVMVAGIAAFLARVGWRDTVARGNRYRVTSVERVGATTDITLAPMSASIGYRAGQFAVLKLELDGLTEPHVFTIASPPSNGELRFLIRDLGDWTSKIQEADLVGAEATIEGPYGTFDPIGHESGPVVWVAGGVGITPFLAAVETLPVANDGERPVLYYCVRSRADAMALDELEAAAAAGRIDLEVRSSTESNRFDDEVLVQRFGSMGLSDAHVAACGPTSLLASVDRSARAAGASRIETEDFDIRGGIGPDLSTHIAELTGT